jgi:DNA-binding NtrC family response regulator
MDMTPELQPELVRLAALMADGQPRNELFHRLDIIHVSTPPLRERKRDVPALVRHFLGRARRSRPRRLRTITNAAMNALVGYSWPGDVRELHDVVDQMAAAAGSGVIEIDDVPLHIRECHTAEGLYDAMVATHTSFWTAVYPLFMNRQITRSQLRAIVSLGLAATGGQYKAVARLFNLPMPHDYKRFLNFLDHFECKPSFKDFRGVPPHLTARRHRHK